MANLMSGTSTWVAGTADTASTLHNGVDERKAEHINGPAAAVVGMQGKLGAAASLVGTKTDLATRLAVGIAANGRLTSAEAGDIIMSGRSSKTGWLKCDGAEYDRSVFSELFAAIGTTFGSGNGTSTFNVPNLCGRSPMGTGTGAGGGATGTGEVSGGDALTDVALGQWKGENAHLLTGRESGIQQHSHTYNTAFTPVGGAAGSDLRGNWGNYQTGNAGHADALDAHNTVHPVLGLNFFIKT